MSERIEGVSTPAPARSSFGTSLARFFRFLLRLLALVVFGGLLGVGIFYGVPWAYRTYLQPLERSMNQVQEQVAAQEQVNQQNLALLGDYQERLTAIEVQVDTLKQQASEFQSSLDILAQEDSSLAEQLQSLTAENSQAAEEVQGKFNAVDNSQAELQGQLSVLEDGLAKTGEAVSSLEQAMAAQDSPVAALRRELIQVKAMEYLTRSRIFLAENNPGTARQNIEAALELVVSLEELVPDFQVEALADIRSRLEQVLENFDTAPIIAAQDLEAAWQLLQDGLPGEPPIAPSGSSQAGETTTPAPTSTPAP